MPDRGARYADKKISEIDRKLRQTYKQAQQELTKKLNDFNRKFKADDKKKQQQLADGEITEREYKDWLSRKVFQQEIWENKVKQAEQVMLHHNRFAMQIVNDSKFDVFAENYYSEAFRANWIVQGIGFEVYNTQAIEELLANDPQILPKWKVDEKKDYTWNEKKVNNIITQGIIQGEGVEQITQKLCRDLSTLNENRMRLFARTAMTEAQNAGRQVQMEQAADMGIEINKMWMAVHDSRTRDSHRAMDGEEVPFDSHFSNGLMHPGDPNGAPSETYNCRCTMVSIYPKYEDRSKKYGEGVTIDGLSYNAWKTEHQMKGVWQPRSLKEEIELYVLDNQANITTEEKQQRKNVPFANAETKEEAEAYALEHFGNKYSSISYRGIDIEYANACNRVLTEIKDQYDLSALKGIQPMNMRSTMFKGSTADAAYHWGGDGTLYINPTYYKSTKAFADHVQQIADLQKTIMDGGHLLLDSGKYNEKETRYIETLLKTGRQCVAQSYDFAEGTFVHESGHMLEDKIFRKLWDDEFGTAGIFDGTQKKLEESMMKYGGNISGYAISSRREYVAESFTAWWYGESDKLDPALVRVFERARKQ